ncbi:complement C1q-like protein 4 [Branchiostoma floridae x Branchiostoma japonicum]
MMLVTVILLLAPMISAQSSASGGDDSCKHVTNNQNITVVAPTGQKGDKGDPGPSGYCGTKGDMRPSCPPVGVFSASRTLALDAPDGNKVVTYDNVYVNVGGAYNKSSGKFVAPVAGIYSFTFNGMTRPISSASYWIALIQNDLPRATLWEDNTSTGSVLASSNTVILQLAIGDEVFVELRQGKFLNSNFNRHVTYSGFLIHAD